MILDSLLKQAAVRLLVPPVAGFLFYGGWAYLANMDHGTAVALRSGCAHGAYSFTITLLLTALIEWLFRRMVAVPARSLWVTVIVCLILYFSSWAVNVLAGTPNILLTIAPGALISTIYITLYVMTLRRLNRQQAL